MNQEQASQDVARRADDWIAAERRGDTAFLDRALVDDFVAVGPLGFRLTKREWIGRHNSGDLRYDSLDLDDVAVRVYDEMAVLIGRQVQDATFRGNRIPMEQLRTTVVLAYRHGDWQLVSIHMSPIAPPPSFARPPGGGS